jgi:hypothetical protein
MDGQAQILFQFGDFGSIGNVLWFIFFIVFMLFYQRIMVSQMLWKLEQTAEMLERMAVKGKKFVLKKISKKPSKETNDNVSSFMDFFVIEPVNLDPYGIMRKLEHLDNLSEKRFKYFVKEVAPDLDSVSQANIVMGLSGAISLNQVAKIVRHYVETIRKTKNLQLAMILQMQMPMIERIAKALLNGTESLSNGWPIGDCAGSLIVAHMIGNQRTKEIEEDTLMTVKRINGKTVYLIKAKGPGGELGKLGKAVEKIIKQKKISKIITIDAAAKLEGEKTGSVAEGIGVAIGGIGVDRSYIENIAVQKNIPLDSIVVKMSQEEAIQPLMNEIMSAKNRVIKLVEENIKKTRGNLIVVGVGNSAGVGNNKKAAEEAEKLAKQVLNIIKSRKKEKKGFFNWIGG